MRSDLVETKERVSAVLVETEIVDGRAGSPVLERLHALVRKGYKAEIGVGAETELVVLRHVGRTPDLVLHSDGVVEPYPGRWPRHKRSIEPPQPFRAGDVAEQLRFMRFLDSIPKPSLRDRTRRFRHKYIYLPLVVAILLGVHLAFTAMLVAD